MEKKSFFDKFKKNLPEGPVKIEKSAKAPVQGAPVPMMKKGGIPDVARLQMQAQMQAQQAQKARPPKAPEQAVSPVEESPPVMQAPAQSGEAVDDDAKQFAVISGFPSGAADDFPDSPETIHSPAAARAAEEAKSPPVPPKRVKQAARAAYSPPVDPPVRRGSPKEVVPPVVPGRRVGGASRVPPRLEEKKTTPVWVFSAAGLAAVILIVWGVCSAIQSAKRVPVHLSLAYSDGEPYIIKKGSKHKAVMPPGGLLRVGNTVETTNFPRTVIQVEKDNYFVAGPNTQFTVLGMRKAQGMKDIILKLKLDKGRLWIDHPKWFRVTVETPLIEVEPEVGSTEIKVVENGDVKVVSWRGEAKYRPLVGKERQPHPDQVIVLGERETSTMTAGNVISPAQSIDVRAMDTWEAWNLGIKLPEVVEGELLDPDTAYKDMQKHGFAYSKMYYGQPEPDPEPNQGDSEEQSNVNEDPSTEGDIAMNDSGTKAISPGNSGGTKGGGMKQGGSQGSQQAGGMKQGGSRGNQQAGGMKQGGSQGSQQAGGMQQGGSQGSQQAGGMQQGGSQGGGFSQGGSSSQGAFDSAWQGGSLSQSGGMKNNSGGMNNNSGGMNNNSGGNVAWNQSGSTKKSTYPTAGSGNNNRQGSSQSSGSNQGGQTQLPQLPGGNSMQFQKYQKNQKNDKNDNKSSQPSGGNYSQGGGGGAKSNSGAPPMPDDGPMKEVKAPRGWSGGSDDGVSTKNLPGYAIGSKPVTEGVSKKGGGKETTSLKAAPIGYEVGDAPVSADGAEEWQMSAKTSSGAVLWYRVTNAGSGASGNTDSMSGGGSGGGSTSGGAMSGTMNFWVEVHNRGTGAAQSVNAVLKCYDEKGVLYFTDTQLVGNLGPGQKGNAVLMFPKPGQSQRSMIEISAVGSQSACGRH
ncbi:MAG: hypothetical protein AB2L14_25540 [Candidatus Xenobiia bacterium LiM19]